jgi:hypothetical protein
VAMIQSALVAKEDPGEAIRLLDQARVLAPGTLVEETALRRELVLADEIADIDKFTFLSSEYIWRFPSSAYFESFRQRFVASTIHFGLTIKPTQFAALEELGWPSQFLRPARALFADGSKRHHRRQTRRRPLCRFEGGPIVGGGQCRAGAIETL